MAPLRYSLLPLLCSVMLWGQPFSVSVHLRTPTPASLDAWRTDPTIVRVILSNVGAVEREIVVGIVLTNRTTGQTATTNNSHPCMPVFRLAPGETRTLTGPDIICERALNLDPAIRTSVTTAGAIPEGDYEFCVTILDAADRRTELATTGARCATARIIWPEPPVLVRPLNTDAAQRCDQAILLQWQPINPVPPTGVQYRVRAVGMVEGQLPRQALEAATRSETIADAVVGGTSFTIEPNNPVLLDLVQRRSPRFTGIAWQVEAQDMSGRPIATRGGTRGKSDIGTFNVDCPGTGSTASCTGAMTLHAYYPRHNDTIPWLPPHFIVQWGPYCDDVLRMQYTLRVNREGGGNVGTNTRSLNWPRGPIEGQGLTGYSNAADRARLIITNQWDDRGNPVTWNNSLRRGETYTWSVDATLTRREGRDERTYTVTTGERTINLGLRMPTEPTPAHGATLSSGRGVTLSWTIPPPEQLSYEPPDLLTVRSGGHSGMMFGAAVEFIRVLVARDSTFRTLVASQCWTIPSSGNFVTNDARASELFGRKNARSIDLPEGTYYWRVEYASPSDTSNPYRRGPVWLFRIGAGVAATECIRLRPNVPEHRSTVTSPSNGRIQFSIVAEPPINLEAIQRYQLRIWQMNSSSEDRATVRARRPEIDLTVSRTGGTIPLREISRSGSEVRIALEMINASGAMHTFTALNGQTYLWECILDFDNAHIRSDGTPCTADPPQKSCEGIFTFRQGECNDPCEVSPPGNTTPLAGTLTPGAVVRIGNFEAELTRVSGGNENLSGEALVRIPWLGIRVQTRFSGIAVNTDRQVYRGQLEAVQASGSPLTDELANRLSRELGLTTEQLNAVNDFINNQRRLLSMMSGSEPVTMPIGFDRTIEGFRIAVGIIGMVFQPTGARLNAVLVYPLPWLGPGQSLGFGVRNICFSANGLGSSFDIYLASDLGYRASDNSWAFNFKAPQAARDGLPADSGTYVRITCGGFEFLRVAAEVEFPRTWMVPAPDDGRSNVRLRFTTRIRGTGDFIASASMSPFSPAGVPGFVMRCENVTVDLSDRDNPEGIVFPSGYTGSTDNSWRGFYIGQLTLQLPEGIRGWRSSEPPRATIRHLLADRTGLSLEATVTNILRYPESNIGGWGGSIDTLGLIIRQNSLHRGWMSGRILVPVSDSALVYSAILRDTAGGIRFEFTVQPRGTLNIPLWAASLQLDNTSWVRLEAGAGVGRGFVARANFTGRISFGGTRDIPLTMGGIQFQNMLIRTDQRPYISVGSWSFASPPHSILGPPEPEPLPPDGSGSGSRTAGGFPISIRQFDLVSGERREGPGVGVRIGVDVNLQAGSNGISGGTVISVWGAFRSGSEGPPSFVFSGIDLDSIGVRADMGAVEIEGHVRFYNNDPTYGNGFRGGVRANFVRMVVVDATVQFGSIAAPTSYRYWYVDARAIIASGIPVFSGVGIYGFGGGAWYNMRRENEPTPVTPAGSDARETAASRGAAGSTNSGARYVPSYSSSGETFGFYALVTVGTHPEPKAFNCDVRLEVSFVGGGIHEIRLRGDGWMMAGLLERRTAPVRLTAEISYTFPTRTFHGDFGVTANLEAASATGRMVIHFAPDVWYVKIGDPEGERIQVRVLRDMIRLQAYFMAGMNLPSLPPIPREVIELTGPIPAPVRPDAIGRGNGFAFGASANIAPPELRFLIFYASMRFIIGCDMALLDYGASARCTDGRPMGANGWYATGQMYARVDASIGLDVDLMFVSGRFEILGLRVGAALQAGLPNPTWLAGAVGGYYSILGGAVSGYCNFQFTLGERCTPPVESPLASLDMISDIAPRDGETNVSLFAEPTAFFNLEPDRPFALEAMRDDGRTETKVYRIRVGSFRMWRLGGGRPVEITVYGPVNRSTREAPARAIIPTAPLEGLTRYRVAVTAYGQEYTGGGFARRPGETIDQASDRAASELSRATSWRDVQRARGGGRIEQTVGATFTTQPRPDTIPPEWVYLAYPRPRQRFFLQDECRNGDITLLVDQHWIFPRSGSEERRGDTVRLYRVRFANLATGERTEVPLMTSQIPRPLANGERASTSRPSARQITFTIPRLANNAIYAVQVIRRDSVIQRARAVTGSFAEPVLAESTRRAIANSSALMGTLYRRLLEREGSTLVLARRYRPSGFDVGRAVASNEKLLYVYFFRTSQYNRLEEKLRTLGTERTDSVNVIAGLIPVIGLAPSITSAEGFDPHDLQWQTTSASPTGTVQEYSIPPLLSTSALARTDQWHINFANPYVYGEMEWMYNLARGSSMRSDRWQWNTAIRDGRVMFEASRTSHTALSDIEITASAGDPSFHALTMVMQYVTFSVDWSRSTATGRRYSSAEPRVTTFFYDQPTWVALDMHNARREASRLIPWCQCGYSGDVSCDATTCSRLRRIAARQFVWPYRNSDYTTWWSYPRCQDPDRYRAFQYRFRY